MTRSALLLWLLPLLASCSGSEIVGLHIAVQPDGSAAITARALMESATPSHAEVLGTGVMWGRRAALTYTQGTVAKLEDLGFGDKSLRITPRIDANKITVHLERSAGTGVRAPGEAA